MPTPSAPDFLTIEEAARILRIGRTAAYELARTWRATGGQDGLPVVAFGRLLRVPRTALESLSGGPITCPSQPRPPLAQPEPLAPVVARRPDPPRGAHGGRSRRARVLRDQPKLPLA